MQQLSILNKRPLANDSFGIETTLLIEFDSLWADGRSKVVVQGSIDNDLKPMSITKCRALYFSLKKRPNG